MPRNNGVYTLPPVYFAETGETIQPNQHNIPLQDIAQALTGSLPRDGSAAMTGDLPMGGRKATGLGAATAPGDAVRLDQVLPNTGWLSSVAALTMAADRIPYATGVTAAALAVFTAAGRAVVGAVDAAAQRVALGLGTLATKNKAAVGDIDVTGTPSANTVLFGDRWSGVLGDGQTWQAVTRTPGAVYQNTTGRPIMVAINGTGGFTSLMVGESSPPTLRIAYNSAGGVGQNEQYHISAVIPNGTYYSLSGGYGDVRELR